MKLAVDAIDMQRAVHAAAVGATLVRAFERFFDEIVAQLKLLRVVTERSLNANPQQTHTRDAKRHERAST